MWYEAPGAVKVGVAGDGPVTMGAQMGDGGWEVASWEPEVGWEVEVEV